MKREEEERMTVELYDELKGPRYRAHLRVTPVYLYWTDIGDHEDDDPMLDWRDPEEGCR